MSSFDQVTSFTIPACIYRLPHFYHTDIDVYNQSPLSKQEAFALNMKLKLFIIVNFSRESNPRR